MGDATGHGLKAGNMVVATKGLFNVLSSDGSLEDILKTSSLAIKRMNFHMVTMCPALVRIKDRKIEYASAGMPPMLIFRNDTGEIEQLVLKAMPLGAFVDFPYTMTESRIFPGDVILLASDGLTELFGSNQEPFGSSRVQKALKESEGRSADKIVEHILERANEWRAGSPLNDDLTVLTIKVRA